jgi:5-methylcytosine-specific restriction endonuclease McrA
MRNKLGQFVKGLIPFNKGTHITNAGSFKKGHKLLGKNIGEIMRGRPSRMKGKHHTEEAKEKNRVAHLGNVAWNKGLGNKTPENKRVWHSVEMRLWRESVFARDNWTCQKCLVKGGTLRPHHILNFAEFKELRFAIDNGITLCDSCHKKFHKKYKNRHNTMQQINDFLGIVGQNC